MKIDQFLWTDPIGWDRSLSESPLARDAQLVLAFGSGRIFSEQNGPTALSAAFPNAHIVGCSTGGEILGARVLDGSIAVTALQLEHGGVKVARTRIDRADSSYAAGQELVRHLDPQGLRHVVVLSEGLLVNSSELVDGINAAVPRGVSVTGGFAADSNNLQVTHVWCDGEPESTAAVAIGLYSERLKVGFAASGGWGPFGPNRLITWSRKNVLYEFDGRPALSLYKQYLGEHAAGLPATGLMFPLELRTGHGTGRVLRALLAVDEKEQSITFAGNVPEGATARFMVGHIEDLIEGTLAAAQVAKGQVVPEFSLIVSCNARRAVLKQRVEEETEAVCEVLQAGKFTGVYS